MTRGNDAGRPSPEASGGGALSGDPRTIDPTTEIGTVRLTVSDLERSQAFYEQVVGLSASLQQDTTLTLSAPGAPPLIELLGDSSARPLDRRATGLYHLAILVPSRRDLARSLWRLAARRWPLDGASDHLVSEALYLSDPDGNGIEIYHDRPRAEWPRSGDQLQMATLPLDLDDVMGELNGRSAIEAGARGGPGANGNLVAAGTQIGHVHLQVADLREAEEFYSGILGFQVTVRSYPGALFVSAGGYHHHIGLNTWHSAGGRPPAAGSVGLREFEVVLGDERTLDDAVGRVRAAGLQRETVGSGARVRDPAGNAVLLRSR